MVIIRKLLSFLREKIVTTIHGIIHPVLFNILKAKKTYRLPHPRVQ
jgi:hypothetical protein